LQPIPELASNPSLVPFRGSSGHKRRVTFNLSLWFFIHQESQFFTADTIKIARTKIQIAMIALNIAPVGPASTFL
jgi:hypothetical protein